MTWPTMEQVPSMSWEETRFWINTLPGTRSTEQVAIIRAICLKNVSYWPKQERPHIPIEAPPPRPAPTEPPPPKKKPKPKPEPKTADLDHFKSLFQRP